MMNDYKQGEKEAKIILESLGIVFDEEYYDDNSKKSMPDLKSIDGMFYEVTHTVHNNGAARCENEYYRPLKGESYDEMLKRHGEIETECEKAINRVFNGLYDRNSEGNLTPQGLKRYHKDCALIENHLGYNPMEMDFNERQSEFKCDIPSFIHSPDNIIKAIEKKAHKHDGKDISLFVFVTQDEFRLMKDLLKQINISYSAKSFVHKMVNSSFLTIYVCKWDFGKQKYNLDNPSIMKFINGEKNWVEYN